MRPKVNTERLSLMAKRSRMRRNTEGKIGNGILACEGVLASFAGWACISFIPVLLAVGFTLTLHADVAESVVDAIPSTKRELVNTPALAGVMRSVEAARASGKPAGDDVMNQLKASISVAHENGVPLALMLYNKWSDDAQMRLALASQIAWRGSSMKYGWETFDTLVDGFLLARDAPISVFSDRPKLLGVDDLVRGSVLDSLAGLLFPDGNESAGSANSPPSQLILMLNSSLAANKLDTEKRAQVVLALERVKDFQKNPPPYAFEKWRVASQQLQDASKKWGKPSKSSSPIPKITVESTVTGLSQAPSKSHIRSQPSASGSAYESTSPGWFVWIAIVIVTTGGSLWMFLRKSSK